MLTATIVRAEHRPALTLEGQVNGTAILRIQGTRVDVDNSGGSFSGLNYRFQTPLSSDGQKIDVADRRGVVRVKVLEQPRRDNNFTATVQIDSRGRNSEPVLLDFYWDDSSNSRDDRLNSRDDYRYGNRSQKDAFGNPTANDPFGNRGQRDSSVFGNSRDPRDDYAYSTRNRRDDRFDSNQAQSTRSVGTARWSGQVDGQVQVMFRGNRAWTQTVSGQNVLGDRSKFGSSLPRTAVEASVNKLHGRGTVNIVETPSPSNNFTLVVQIDDNEAGSDSYELEVSWK